MIALGLVTRHWAPWALAGGLAAAHLGRKARQGCFAVPSWQTYVRVPLVPLAIHAETVAGIVSRHLRRRGRAAAAR